MTKYVTFDEFRLVFLVPADLDDPAAQALKRVLESRLFRSALHRAVRQVVRQYPDLDLLKFRLSV